MVRGAPDPSTPRAAGSLLTDHRVSPPPGAREPGGGRVYLAAARAARALRAGGRPGGTGAVRPPRPRHPPARPAAAPGASAQTCPGGRAAPADAPPLRRGPEPPGRPHEHARAPLREALSRCRRHALGLGRGRGPPLAAARAPRGRRGPAGAEEAAAARPARGTPQRHRGQRRGAARLPQGTRRRRTGLGRAHPCGAARVGASPSGAPAPHPTLCPLGSKAPSRPVGWGFGQDLL